MLAQKDVQLPCLLVDPCWPCSMFTIFYLLLAFFTGGIIPFQTAANSNLKQQMSSPLLASFVNCTVGSIALFIIMMLSTDESFYRSSEEWASYDWWMYTSGALGAIILMVAMTLLIKLGMVGTSLATMTGMMVTGMVLDEFGAFGMPVHEFDAIRAIGLVIMILGVMAALRVFAHIKQHAATFSLFTVLWFLLGCFSGSLLATQAAINAVFRVELHSVLYCALISMVSTSAIVLVLAFCFKQYPTRLRKIQINGRWWLFIGGFIGLTNIILSAELVPLIGAGCLMTLCIAGQLAASLLLDYFGFMEVKKRAVSLSQIIGLIMIIGAVAFIRMA